MVCTPNKPEHARSRLDIDYNKMKEKYICKHQTKSMKALSGSLNMGVLDGNHKQAIRNITRLQNCLPDKLSTFCKKHLQTLLELNICEDMCVESVTRRKISTPFSSKKKHRAITANIGLSKDTAAPIYKLIHYLQTRADLNTEGLFRKTGNIGRQRQLKEQIQHGSDTDLQNSQYTAHDVATVLKQMISDLPQPLLTQQYYKAYLQIGAMIKQGEVDVKKQMKALQLMMVLQENSQLLKQLLNLLHRVATIPENKMTADSLGIVFAPCLLCPRTLSAGTMQADSATLSSVVSAMVENAPHVFDFPQELIDDVNQFWKTMENPSKVHTANQDIVKPNVDQVNSDISSMDNVFKIQDKDSEPNKTQIILSKLYAQLRAMPQSAKKKKMLKHKPTEKPSNTESSVKNSDLVRSKKLSKSLKQDFPTLIKITQQEQCNLIEQVSQSCMDLNSDKPCASTPYYKNKLDSDKVCAGSPYNVLVSRQKDSPAVCIVDLDASPYFTKPRQYWSCQNLGNVNRESTLPGSEVCPDITVKDTLCKTLFTEGPLCEETVTIPSSISTSRDTLIESSRKSLKTPRSQGPVLIFQSHINRLTESFI